MLTSQTFLSKFQQPQLYLFCLAQFFLSNNISEASQIKIKDFSPQKVQTRIAVPFLDRFFSKPNCVTAVFFSLAKRDRKKIKIHVFGQKLSQRIVCDFGILNKV